MRAVYGKLDLSPFPLTITVPDTNGTVTRWFCRKESGLLGLRVLAVLPTRIGKRAVSERRRSRQSLTLAAASEKISVLW
jgi:hypothetical protein